MFADRSQTLLWQDIQLSEPQEWRDLSWQSSYRLYHLLLFAQKPSDTALLPQRFFLQPSSAALFVLLLQAPSLLVIACPTQLARAHSNTA